MRSGQIDGLQTISFGDALQQIPSLRGGRFQGLREILAYAYSRQPTTLVLSVQRRKPQVTARQLLVAGVESGVIRYQATFFYEILYSGVESLRLDVPEALASEMNLTAKTVQFAPIEPPPADVAAGYVAWSLTGETEFLGESAFEFNWEQKIDELGVGKSLDVTLPIIRPMDVDRAWGQVAIRKAENVDVRETGELVGLRPIDPQTDLMPGAAVEDAARAFEFHDDWLLQIKATRYELEEVKRTSIERAVLRMVVGHDRKTSVQALYRVRTARQRLEVQLPAKFDPNKGFNLNPLRINGQSTELERGEKGEYYVPLVNQNPETPFLLELRYTVESGYERLEFPVFPSDPAVQKVYMCVYLPEELALLGSRGPWTSEFANRWRHVLYDRPNVNPDDKDMVRWVTNGIPLNVDPSGDFQIQGRLHTFSTLRPQPPPQGSLRLIVFNKDGLNALVFLLITAPGVIMVVLPLGTRLLVVGLLLIGLVLSGVFLPTFSLQVMDEVLLIAVLLVLAVWILMFLVRFSRQRVVALAGAGGPVDAIHRESPPLPSAPAKRTADAPNANSSPAPSDRPTAASDEHPSDQERDQEKGGSPDV